MKQFFMFEIPFLSRNVDNNSGVLPFQTYTLSIQVKDRDIHLYEYYI